MTKKLNKNEIDLINVIEILWKEKLKILIFILLSLSSVYILEIYKKPINTDIKARTEIKTITAFDEAEYIFYNSIISRIKPFNDISKKYNINDDKIVYESTDIMKYGSIQEELKIYNIDKEFLLNLFIDKLTDKSNLVELIKKTEYFNREDFSNISDYENEVNLFATKVKIENNKNNFFIAMNLSDTNQHKEFLQLLDREINSQIQKNISQLFNNNLAYMDRLRKFRLEDIELALKVTKSGSDKDQLIKQKNIIIEDRYVDRIKDILDETPIYKPNIFYAAKIDFNSTEYSNVSKQERTLTSNLIVAVIFGALLGIFFVLIANAIQNRK